MSRNTVHKFLVSESFPEQSRRPYAGSILDPYKPYILDRWKAGCWNGTQLLEEIKKLGYTGSDALFRLFITSVRKHHQVAGTSAELSLDADEVKVSSPVVDPASKRLYRAFGDSSSSGERWGYMALLQQRFLDTCY
jgi:transposase